MCGEIADTDILADVLIKKGGSYHEEEKEQLEAEEMLIPSSYVEGQATVTGIAF